jgi:hypothetical protein
MGRDQLIRSRTFRTGVQSLTCEGGRYFMHIRNRSYRSKVEVPAVNVPRWLAYFDRPGGYPRRIEQGASDGTPP